MANQDFTTYVSVDPNSDFTITTDRITFTTLNRSVTAYVTSDKGVGYFSNSFAIDLTVCITAKTAGDDGPILWCITNALGSYADLYVADESFLWVYLSNPSNPDEVRLHLSESDSGTPYGTDYYALSLSTEYFLRIVRNESIGTYGTLYCYIYSDVARTILLATLSVALHTSKKDFRYVYGIQSYDASGVYAFSGYVDSLDLDVSGTPTVTTQSCTVILETTATGNGNITSIGVAVISQHGHCWGLTTNPTTSDNKTENGAGSVGAYTSALTGLTRGARYHIRAYATNVFGTSYGADVEFATDPSGIVQIAFAQSIFTESPTFTDVSAEVISDYIKRGRMHDLDRVEAGTVVIILKNLSGNWWRENTAGIYYIAAGVEVIKPIILVRISAVWASTTYPLFYGVIESFKPDWVDDRGGKIPTMTISCVDIFKVFNRMRLQALPGAVGAHTFVAGITNTGTSGDAGQKLVQVKSLSDSLTEGCDIKLFHVGQTITIGDDAASEINSIASIDENTYILTMTTNLANSYTTATHGYVKKFPARLSGTRIKDICYELGWPIALTTISAGHVTIAELVPPTGGTSGLEHLLDVAEAESGIIFVDDDGKLIFQDRDDRLGTTSKATFSDDGTHNFYTLPELEDDDELIYNEARISGDAIDEQVYRDLDYQENQGQRCLPRTASVINSNADAFDQAYTIVERYKDSIMRCRNLLILPERDPANLFPIVFDYKISEKIRLELNQTPNTAMLGREYHIEAIEHRKKQGEPWETRWQLWDVNRFRIIQAEHSGYLYAESVVSYATAHDAAASTSPAVNDDDVIGVGQSNDGGSDWLIFRGFLQFDTSAIGTGSIASAEIIVEVSGYFVIDNAFSFRLVPAGAGVANPLVDADYATLHDQSTDYGSVTVAVSAINRKILIITLTPAGIAAINKTGITYFGIRSSLDIAATAPPGSEQEYITVEGTGAGSEFVPRLIVKLNEVF